MKKKILTITMLTLISLTSCGTLGNKNTYSENQNTASPIIDATPIPETEISPSSSNLNNSIYPVTQAFKSVLLNEKTFSFTNKAPNYEKNTVEKYNGYIKDFECLNDCEYTIKQFTIIDLDGDGITEIVLYLEDADGYLILRYKDEKVLGNYIPYRCFEQLKTNGLFMSSSGADANTIGKLFFLQDTFFYSDKIQSYSGNYSVFDISTNKKTWDEEYQAFRKLSKVEWYNYTKEVIEKKFVDNPIPSESRILSKQEISDRQDYLDSLAYLIDLSSADMKEYKSYYNACNDEMNKLYELCLEKLTGDEKDNLINIQSKWQENLDKVLSNNVSDIPYYYCGNILFRRTFYLLNIYYDYHFYD